MSTEKAPKPSHAKLVFTNGLQRGVSMSRKARESLDHASSNMIQLLAARAARLAKDGTVLSRHTEAAVRMTLPPALAEASLNAGTVAVDKMKDGKGSRTTRAGLFIPIARVERHFRIGAKGLRVAKSVPTIVAATVGVVVRYLLDQGRKRAEESRAKIVKAAFIGDVISRCPELRRVVGAGPKPSQKRSLFKGLIPRTKRRRRASSAVKTVERSDDNPSEDADEAEEHGESSNRGESSDNESMDTDDVVEEE